MRAFVFATAALLVGVTQASAQTYQLTYTGNKLIDNPGNKPINHVKKLRFLLSSSSPFPKGTCFSAPFTDLSSYTDGIDTLATLSATGYVYDPNNSQIMLCSDKSGKSIKSWQITLMFDGPGQGGCADIYTGQTFSTQYRENYDLAALALAKRKCGYAVRADSNRTAAGKWKFSVLN